MKNETMKLEIEFPANYKLIKRKSKKLLILLHGFAQSNQTVLEKFKDAVSDEYDILAPNGPFPIPKIRKDYIERRYAWYFFDRHTNTYDIDYNFPSKVISKMVAKLGYENTPKTILGYSQGGYLSPFAALELREVESIIGLSCTFKWQYLPEEIPFNIYAIHGTSDEMVDYKNSKEHFDILKKRTKAESNYISLQNETHELTNSFVEKAINLL